MLPTLWNPAEPVGIRITPPGGAAEEQKEHVPGDDQYDIQNSSMTFIGCSKEYLAGNSCLAPTGITRTPALHGITDSACKNQLVMVSVQYGPINPYIPIRSTTIGKSRVAIDPIAMHTSWRSNSDIASVTRTNQYNQDLGLIHSTNGNHLESSKEGSSIDHKVTIYLHAQNITMLPTNETWYFASQILVSNSGGLILILTAQSTRNSSEYTVTIRCDS
ncbi:triacylglycerol lipase [Dorcoceras hygrometricum]|uniref:Triacylglycerol lipase n=1 Tax=Dorcoceras hygrometricum TaxID=472368 RepID=A0A2Z7CY41_9LAMI|nr:triacylglycerol lipase [Dorcoceras hygrometricum]